MRYYVSTQTDNPNHNHEVHRETCWKLPNAEHRIYLGVFTSSQSALEAAKKHYSDADGCVHCCPEIHRG